MKKISLIIFALMVSFSVAYAHVSAGNNGKYLYVVTAKSAKIVKVSDDRYNLIMQDDQRYVQFFTDRPARKSGIISMADFAKGWLGQRNKLAKNPPNANIEGSALHGFFHGKEQQISANIELLNLSYDQKQQQIIFQLKMMPGSHFDAQNIKLDHVSLFVDQVCLSCIG